MSRGILVAGRRYGVPWARVVTWLDDPRVHELAGNRGQRRERVRAIVLHTTWGRLGELVAGSGPTIGFGYVAANSRAVDKSWDFTVDRDGTIYQQSDPAHWFSWHAGAVNPWSVGIEMAQGQDGALYADQLRSAVELIEVLARVFGIPRVLPWRDGAAQLRVLGAVRAGQYTGLQGLFAHANFTEDRGPGDPGPGAFGVLWAAKGWVGVAW
ncbi:MAG: peptidoglycan recognition family protein [Deltaproteobacteria bacterium]|nr:peptidoglycan recognition family protein [Deltaproteobacteria bacterium]